MRRKVLVLVVAYNAEKTITKLLDRIPQDLMEKTDEVLVADDASRDNTALIAQRYKELKKIDKIKVVKHKENKGYGGNQKWGYSYAIDNDFDIVIMLHGDAQYPPEHILKLIEPIENGKYDFMFGSRIVGHPLKGGMPIYKYIGNLSLTLFENIVLGTRLTEFHSGFRAYSTEALRSIPFQLNSDDFHFDSQIIFQLVSAKRNIGEITIPTFYGNEKSNVNVFSYGSHILLELLKYRLHTLGLRYYKNYDIKPKSRL